MGGVVGGGPTGIVVAGAAVVVEPLGADVVDDAVDATDGVELDEVGAPVVDTDLDDPPELHPQQANTPMPTNATYARVRPTVNANIVSMVPATPATAAHGAGRRRCRQSGR